MPYSEADVCNLALSVLGLREITSLDQKTPEAEKLSRLYPLERDALLSEFNWSFATSHLTLKTLSEEPPANWNFVYSVPVDIIGVQSVHCPTVINPEGIPFLLGSGGRLFADYESAYAYVTLRITDTGSMPAYFIDVFSKRLAFMLAASLQNLGNRIDFAANLYNAAAEAAMVTDASKQLEKPEPVPAIDARLGITQYSEYEEWPL